MIKFWIQTALIIKRTNQSKKFIDHWETQDEQEHLRTIKNRILSNEQRAGYLLELYRKVLKQGQVPINNSSEERELQLSGLVVKRGNVLEVYNPIYATVFNESWIDSELEKLRPYTENFRAWLQSGKKDDSPLLRGQTLEKAESWALGKNLGGEDLDFLRASRAKEKEEEIANKEKEAELERERRAREAAEKAERIQAEAKRQAQQKIRIGTIVLIITLLFAGIFGVLAKIAIQQLHQAKAELEKVEKYLASEEKSYELAKNLSNISHKDQINKLLNQSKNIENTSIKIAFRLSIRALISLYRQELDKAEKFTDRSLTVISLYKSENSDELDNSRETLQVSFLAHFTKGKLLKNQGETDDSLKYYEDAFNLLEDNEFENGNLIIPREIIRFLQRELIDLLAEKPNREELKNRVNQSIKKNYLYDLNELDELLSEEKWQEADKKTWKLMLSIARREQQGWLNGESLEKFPCSTLREIDQSWVKHSKNHFGLSVQKQILESLGFQPTDLPNQLPISESLGSQRDLPDQLQWLKKISELPFLRKSIDFYMKEFNNHLFQRKIMEEFWLIKFYKKVDWLKEKGPTTVGTQVLREKGEWKEEWQSPNISIKKSKKGHLPRLHRIVLRGRSAYRELYGNREWREYSYSNREEVQSESEVSSSLLGRTVTCKI